MSFNVTAKNKSILIVVSFHACLNNRSVRSSQPFDVTGFVTCS